MIMLPSPRILSTTRPSWRTPRRMCQSSASRHRTLTSPPRPVVWVIASRLATRRISSLSTPKQVTLTNSDTIVDKCLGNIIASIMLQTKSTISLICLCLYVCMPPKMTEIVFHHAPPTRRSFNKSLWFPHNKLKRLLCPHNQTSRTRMSRRGNLHCSLNWISLPVFYRGAKALRNVLEDISVVSFLLSQCVGEYLLIMKEFTVQAIFFPHYFCPPKEGRMVYFYAFCEYIVTQIQKHAFLSRWKLKLAKGFRSICLDLELLWDQVSELVNWCSDSLRLYITSLEPVWKHCMRN